mmetsp:Transcript_12117/g.18696  ORF Transcript_12117/g.18696 Transcript_12117/m.18696 type:complete len:92 (+) Transcript_12117:37-312(+)
MASMLLRCACWFGGTDLLPSEESYCDRQQQQCCCSCCGFACGVVMHHNGRGISSSNRVPTEETTTVGCSMNDNYLKEVVIVALYPSIQKNR